jgi:hypothetical protein
VQSVPITTKVYQWIGTGQWFFPGNLVSATSRTDIHDIAEILLGNSISQRIFYKGQPNVSYNVNLPITDIF